MMEQGLLHLYWGDGKGKTTAAMGLALRALGSGKRVVIVQFLKGLVIVAHGGTQMAALERFGVPRRSFHDWCGPNAGGYVLDARDWPEQHILHLVETVQYTKENG